MKRSLHIGINDYPGTNSDLNGCVNDAMAWKEALNKRGFDCQDVLLDNKAFKKAICDAIADIVDANKANDIAVITYAGHGTWIPDTSNGGDEPDGRDEALCPWDMNTTGEVITDDYLYSIFSERNPESKVVFISDSCHSGSVNRMAPRGIGPFAGDPWKFQKARFLPPSFHLTDDGFKVAEQFEKFTVRSKVKESDAVLLMSGCQDTEYSYDAWFNGKPNGAFTYTALWCLDKMKPGSTYNDWYKEIRKYLPHEQWPQTPLISGIDPDWKIFE